MDEYLLLKTNKKRKWANKRLVGLCATLLGNQSANMLLTRAHSNNKWNLNSLRILDYVLNYCTVSYSVIKKMNLNININIGCVSNFVQSVTAAEAIVSHNFFKVML